MGWNFVKCLSFYHELHILTESKFEQDIISYFSQNPDKKRNMHFYFITKERHKRLRKVYPPSYYWFYRQWQKRAYQKAIVLKNTIDFDVVHQLNMAGYREPGYLNQLNLPLVWGPIGGMDTIPWQLLPSTGLYGLVFYGLRNLINLFQMHFKCRVKKFALRSNILIAATKDNHDKIKKIWGRNSTIIPEVGLLHFENMREATWKEKILKICWSGVHIPRKALNLLLHSVKKCNNVNNIEIHVIGSGRSTPGWKKLAKKLGLDQVEWYGWVEKEKALSIMANCHLMCITSLSDLTSTVLLEGLSLGLPVIALDHCGFSNVINKECGIKIPLGSKDDVCTSFSKAIDLLFENENLRMELAKGARKRALDFKWEDKAITINRLYQDAIDDYNRT